MSKENLTEILQRLQADDKTVLKSLFQNYYLSVCKSIHRYIRDKSTVEDIAQDVFIKFWEKRKKMNITSSVAAYLHRMAMNEAISYLRKQKHFESDEILEQKTDTQFQNAEEEVLQDELKQNINNAINGLPPRCQAIFKMSRFEELTYKEIAAKLDISVKTVENQMGKALRVLREKLSGYLSISITIAMVISILEVM